MLLRSQAAPPVWWAWACVAIFTSGACTLLLPSSRGVVALGYALATLYPALLLGGALTYAGRPIPRPLAALALGVAVARAAAWLLGAEALAHGVALVVEPTLAVIAAGVMVGATRGPVGLAERGVGPALAATAALEFASGSAMLSAGALPEVLRLAWLMVAPLLLALQIAAWGAASRRDFERVQELLEERVAEQTERYRTVSELSSDYSFSYRVEDGRIIQAEWVTDALTRITGYDAEALEGLGWVKLLHPDDRPELMARMDEVMNGKRATVEARILTRQGEERFLSIRFGSHRSESDGAVRLVGAARDVTDLVLASRERRRLDLRMREAQRLESLGRLAGGIAHDFNNVLTVILGNARLAQDEQRAGAVDTRLQRIRTAAEYASGLTEQILAYSGKAALTPESLDLSALAAELLDLLRASVSKNATLEVHLPQGLPPVEGDPTQLRQVLLNLVTNASEALGESGGLIRLRTGARGVDERELADHVGYPEAEAGHYVFLEVADSGRGLDPEMVLRIFEPFFTTRSAGRGLGLAVVQGIVRAHRGIISVDSNPERGTVVQVLLPRGGRTPRRETEEIVADAVARVGGRVLVVDDDEAVREVAREFLMRAGFEVHTAAGGRAALALIEAAGEEFDAVVLDLLMPDLSGEATFLALRQLRPELPVVLSSGFDREHAAERFSARGIADFVRKPYDAEALLASVRGVLARRPTPSSED